MTKTINQEDRLDYLLEWFQAETEAEAYQTMAIPQDRQGKWRILQSLMNIRPPKPLPADLLKVQDQYLSACAQEKGIIGLGDIPVLRGPMSIWQGDITRLAVDAIVNAANSKMLGCLVPLHACIDNTIHTYAGVQLRAECHRQMEALRKQYGHQYQQPTALPMLTDAYNLPARKVIHIVGPIVDHDLTPDLEEALAACYRRSLDMCLDNGLKSLAFCCISTGVFHFPGQRAAQIAVDTVSKWDLDHPGAMDRIIFNVFKAEDRQYYEELL